MFHTQNAHLTKCYTICWFLSYICRFFFSKKALFEKVLKSTKVNDFVWKFLASTTNDDWKETFTMNIQIGVNQFSQIVQKSAKTFLTGENIMLDHL